MDKKGLNMAESMEEMFDEYLKNTSKEQRRKDWEKTQAKGFGGPSVSEYLEYSGRTNYTFEPPQKAFFPQLKNELYFSPNIVSGSFFL